MADHVCERCQRTDALTGIGSATVQWWCPDHVDEAIKLVGETITKAREAAEKAFE